ncbi:metallophosphoesterase [Enterococcus sp. AZ072]|uniref:metallophosphoesterase n=1 Tax=unclassified Enterococcus TaxID=2608891 RepID=UPI003D278406
MKYFIADLHFYHEAVITFSDRPFQDVTEMNKQLITNWNKVVKSPKDEVYILGDFVYRGTGEQANRILKKLRGRKYLIKGNHENYLKDEDFDSTLFEWVKDYYSFKYNKRRFVLFHYPILEWDGFYQGAIHLYGHVHNTRAAYFKDMLGVTAMNVGVDMIGYKPISIDEVVQVVSQRELA